MAMRLYMTRKIYRATEIQKMDSSEEIKGGEVTAFRVTNSTTSRMEQPNRMIVMSRAFLRQSADIIRNNYRPRLGCYYQMDDKKTSSILRQSAKSILDKENRNYLPSRYLVAKHRLSSPKASMFSQLEDLTRCGASKDKPFLAKAQGQTKNKPLRRQQRDYEKFKEIFVEPQQNILKRIIEQSVQTSAHQQLGAFNFELIPYISQALVSSSIAPPAPNERSIYEQQVRVEPPSLPNSSIASTLTPGNGYAPSIPPVQLIKESRSFLNDLLLRCQNGSHVQDIQKEAHLNYFLGMTYQKREDYSLASKFFTRFIGYAKLMDDKIGMTLGANRIGCNEYYLGNYQKSLIFHQQNLRLSDSQNSFSGFYNLGMVRRKMGRTNEAIEMFESALQWALQKNGCQEVALLYGQLGTTYQQMGNYEQAMLNFQQCLESSRVSNKRLCLDSLLNITKLRTLHNVRSKSTCDDLIEQSLSLANELDLPNIVEVCLCNFGIIKAQPKLLTGQVDLGQETQVIVRQSD